MFWTWVFLNEIHLIAIAKKSITWFSRMKK